MPGLALIVVEVGLALALLGIARELWLHRAAFRDVRWTVVLVALAAAALALRLAAPLAPFDVNPRSVPSPVSPVGLSWFYGIGHPAWQSLWLLAVPRSWWSLEALFVLGVLGGVAGVLATVAFARAWGADRPTAWLAGMLLALDAAHLRLSATDVQVVPEIALTLAGLAILARHARAPAPDAALLGALCLGLAVHFRPEAAVLPLVALVLLATAPFRFPWRHPATVAGVVLLVGLWALHVGGMVRSAAQSAQKLPFLSAGGVDHGLTVHGWRHLYLLDPAWTSPAHVLAMGLAAWASRLRLRTFLGLLAVVLLLSVLIPDRARSPAGALGFHMVRHQLRAGPYAHVLAAWGARAIADLAGRALPGIVAGVVLGVAGAGKLGTALRPATAQQEYRWLVDHLPDVPPDCTLVTYVPFFDGGLQVPAWVSLLAPERRVVGLEEADRVTGCRVWYRDANCAVRTFGEDPAARTDPEKCRQFEAAHTLAPITEGRLANGRWVYDDYTESPVRVGFYRY